MSYSVDIQATIREGDGGGASLSVTTFGGGTLGRMVQVTISGGRFAQLTAEQQDDLIEVLKFARKRSLVFHPRCPLYNPPQLRPRFTRADAEERWGPDPMSWSAWTCPLCNQLHSGWTFECGRCGSARPNPHQEKA